MAVVPEGSLFWSWLTKKACKQFSEDNLAKSMNSCNHVLWSDESNVITYLAQMVSSMCGDALVRSTKKTVPCLQSGMVVVASWSGAGWLLLVLGSCGSLRETWIPTCTVTFWSRRLCPPFRICFQHNHPKHTAKMTTALLMKVMEWPSMTWTLLSTCGASSSGRWRSTRALIYQQCVCTDINYTESNECLRTVSRKVWDLPTCTYA